MIVDQMIEYLTSALQESTLTQTCVITCKNGVKLHFYTCIHLRDLFEQN